MLYLCIVFLFFSRQICCSTCNFMRKFSYLVTTFRMKWSENWWCDKKKDHSHNEINTRENKSVCETQSDWPNESNDHRANSPNKKEISHNFNALCQISPHRKTDLHSRTPHFFFFKYPFAPCVVHLLALIEFHIHQIDRISRHLYTHPNIYCLLKDI